ncbi:MAG: septum formation protein Maf [Clostridia bacterium]|nr:septum formation protein Maf [Clostridia bacterium]
MNNIILASASPRRQELLKMIFNEFQIIPSFAPEIVPEGLNTEEQPEFLANLKAKDIAEKNPDSLVIGADTSVLFENIILGKPKTKAQARQMLEMLSGNVHRVVTGCAFSAGGVVKSFSVVTNVEFFKLSASEIEEYISTEEPYDKAGGYGIQSKGGLFVKQIIGDYYNVVGLPIARLKRELEIFIK